jgi:hypothetical protein
MMTFTNGEVEYRYLKALVDRDSTEASAALEEFASQLGNAAAAGGGGGGGLDARNLPGTGCDAPPSQIDMDGFKCLMKFPAFRKYFPSFFSVAFGVKIPKKRIKVLSATELCYLGCANGHIHLYVPAGEYGPILTTLGHQLKRCILPSRHKNISADTNSASVSVLALVTAMR